MKKQFLLACFAVLFASCVSTTQKNLEEARFLLDQGKFDEAIALVEPILADEPENNEAKFILASALIGNFALSPKPGCPDTDTGYLGALACMLDEPDTGDSNGLQTFGRIAPEDASFNDDIERAIALLEDTDNTPETPTVDVALQRLIARTFSISTIFQLIGANSANVECNAGTPNTVDDVPDDYDSSNITTADAEQFVDNLELIQSDAAAAGLDIDFGILENVQDILDDLDDTGLGTRDAVIEIFDNSFNSPDQQVCS